MDCIFFSLEDIVFLHLSKSGTRSSKIFPFLTESSGKESSPGFRVLTSLLTSCQGRKARAAREKSNISLPNELLDVVHNGVEADDIISFTQASFKIEEWYYTPSPLPPTPAHEDPPPKNLNSMLRHERQSQRRELFHLLYLATPRMPPFAPLPRCILYLPILSIPLLACFNPKSP